MNICSVYIRNFKSYGDDGVDVNLKDLGPVLITGSNGAGKSSIVESIIWCLFGKLPRKKPPGDRIINWDSGKNCKVTVRLDEGYEVSRTRKFDGHSDLLISKDGIIVENGDSTNANAQKTLESLFKIDFNTFISTVFFAQSAGCFLELTDNSQKQVIKRLFGLGKLQFYADVSKRRLDESESSLKELRHSLKELSNKLNDSQINKSSAERSNNDFEVERQSLISNSQATIDDLRKSQQEVIDINQLKESWQTIEVAKQKSDRLQKTIDNANDYVDKIDVEIRDIQLRKSDLISAKQKHETVIQMLKDQLAEWESKKDSVCPMCETPLTGQYIDDKILEKKNEHAEELSRLTSEIEVTNSRIRELDESSQDLTRKKTLILNKSAKICSKKKQLDESVDKITNDKMTIKEAKTHNNYVNNVNDRITDQENRICELKSQKNPYIDSVCKLEQEINDLTNSIQETEEQICVEEKKSSHLQFIYKAYSDKRNIRSFIISAHLPLLNSRLSYYMNEMDIGRDMQFDHLLNMKSDKWDYDMHSGGEQKRIDLALMCALHDTSQSIHGSQTNILVLDEIDKELDDKGVDAYVRLIMDDLSRRVSTVLVISHKDEISHAFPSQIKVNNKNGNTVLDGI